MVNYGGNHIGRGERMTNKTAAIKVIECLRSSGFGALLAGGCVRDMLLGRRANDYDVATDAVPTDVIKLFKRTIKVGAKFGVVIVLIHNQQVEVATFRTETGYADGRHPEAVEFTTAKEDAARRDFTINGMFYDPLEKKVIDFVSGRADLKNRLIRTIGSARRRFGEDWLRMLRAVRFSSQLGFVIESKTWSAIRQNAGSITGISGERIAMELDGILACPNRWRGADMLIKSGLAEAIFPGFVDAGAESAVRVLGKLRQRIDFALGLAAFFAGCETAFALEKCKVLKLSRNQSKHIKFLLANRGGLLDENMGLAELRMIAGGPYFEDLYELEKAIRNTAGDSKGISALRKLRKRINALGDIELHPRPLLNGHHLIRLGAVPGPVLGQLSEEMYVAQLEGKLKSSGQAEQWVREWLKRHRIVEK